MIVPFDDVHIRLAVINMTEVARDNSGRIKRVIIHATTASYVFEPDAPGFDSALAFHHAFKSDGFFEGLAAGITIDEIESGPKPDDA